MINNSPAQSSGQLSNLLHKARAAQIGEIHSWASGQYRKDATGWSKIKQDVQNELTKRVITDMGRFRHPDGNYSLHENPAARAQLYKYRANQLEAWANGNFDSDYDRDYFTRLNLSPDQARAKVAEYRALAKQTDPKDLGYNMPSTASQRYKTALQEKLAAMYRAHLEEQSKPKREKINQLAAHADALDKRYEELDKTLGELNEQKDELENTEYVESDDSYDVEKIDQQIEELETKISDIESELETLADTASDSRDKYDDDLTALDNSIEDKVEAYSNALGEKLDNLTSTVYDKLSDIPSADKLGSIDAVLSHQKMKLANDMLSPEEFRKQASATVRLSDYHKDLRKKLLVRLEKEARRRGIMKARPLMGRKTFRGLEISIENTPGSIRAGVDSTGRAWRTKFSLPYGYIRQTEGQDGDHVDCFLGDNEDAPEVFIVRQVDLNGVYDEDKVMLGFDSAEAAKEAYLKHYDRPDYFGSMDTMPFARFQEQVYKTKGKPGPVQKAERVPGGLAAGRPDSDFDPEALDQGARVEMEHTTDPAVAREIAKDHLTEDPDYYRKLQFVEGKSSMRLQRLLERRGEIAKALVRKQITDKNGKRTTVLINPNKDQETTNEPIVEETENAESRIGADAGNDGTGSRGISSAGTGVSGADVSQPYAHERIQLARGEHTRFAGANYLSENLRKLLKGFQRDYVNLAIEKFEAGEPGSFCMDGTGTGKTLQQLALAQTFRDRNPDSKVLIVTQDQRIIDRAFGGAAVKSGIAFSQVSDASEMTAPGIYITTYSRLETVKDASTDLIIWDESHNLKNFGKSEKAAHGVEMIEKSKHSACFSATPIDRGSQMRYVCAALRLDFARTMDYLGYVEEGNRWVARESAEEIAFKIDSIFQDMTGDGLAVKREIKMDNLDLVFSNMELTSEMQDRYNSAMAVLEEGAAPKQRATILLGLRRLVEEFKLDTAVQKIQEHLKAGKQIVLFATRVEDSAIRGDTETYSVGTLKEISRRLDAMGIAHSKVFSSNPESKEEIRKFQDGEHKVILTTPQSGGTGISLDDSKGVAPRVAVIMSPPFSAMDFIQMIGRVNRLNTKSRAMADFIVTPTFIDQWNKDIIANKLTHLGAAVQGDYGKLDIHSLERAAYLSEGEIKDMNEQAGTPGRHIGVTEQRPFTRSAYQAGAAPAASSGASLTPTRPLRNVREFQAYLPKNARGQWDALGGKWPDSILNFGPHAGSSLSEVAKKDPGYIGRIYKNATGEQLGPELVRQIGWMPIVMQKSLHSFLARARRFIMQKARNTSHLVRKIITNKRGHRQTVFVLPGAKVAQAEQSIPEHTKEWKEKGVYSKFFKAWFGDWDTDPENASKAINPKTGKPDRARPYSAVTDDDGSPIAVYHGTTHKFNEFDRSKANPESHFGAGFYFSSERFDSADNYADEEGPDVRNKIEALTERLEGEGVDPEEAREQARKTVLGENDPQLLKCFLNIRKPVYFGESGDGKKPTFFEVESPYDEEYDEYGEPEGPGVDLYQNIIHAIQHFDSRGDAESAIDGMQAWFADHYEGFTLDELRTALNEQHSLMDVVDDEGRIVIGEILRRALERSGYDGIIYNDASKVFTGMHIPPNTRHYVVFRPEQIKSQDNEGSFDDYSGNIYKGLVSAAGLMALIKARDLTKLKKEIVTNKRGIRQTVYKRILHEVKSVEGQKVHTDFDTLQKVQDQIRAKPIPTLEKAKLLSNLEKRTHEFVLTAAPAAPRTSISSTDSANVVQLHREAVDQNPQVIQRVALDAIRAESQIRKSFDAEQLRELADSIAQVGLMAPIVLRPDSATPGQFLIVAGERRFRAMQMLAKEGRIDPSSDAIVKTLSDKEKDILQLIENHVRVNNTPLEISDHYTKLVEAHKMTPKDISAATGDSPQKVRDYLSLGNLAPELRAALKRGDSTLNKTAAIILSALPHGMQLRAFGNYLRQNMTTAQLRQYVKQMNENKDVALFGEDEGKGAIQIAAQKKLGEHNADKLVGDLNRMLEKQREAVFKFVNQKGELSALGVIAAGQVQNTLSELDRLQGEIERVKGLIRRQHEKTANEGGLF